MQHISFSTKEKLDYLQAHLKEGKKAELREFFILDKDLKVFKKLSSITVLSRGFVIANLIIPKGTKIYVGYVGLLGELKLRAEKAYVFSICEEGRPHHSYGFSIHDKRFKYTKGETVRPTEEFSLLHSSCQSGIHFFLTLKEAWEY